MDDNISFEAGDISFDGDGISFDVGSVSFEPGSAPVSDTAIPQMVSLQWDDVMEVIRRTESKRRLPRSLTLEVKREYQFINGLRREALAELIPELPEPGTDIYVLSNGIGAERKDGKDTREFDFGAFLPHLVQMAAPEGGADVYISTWAMNERGALGIIDLKQSGMIRRVSICTDRYFNTRSAHVAHLLLSSMERGVDRYISFRNHAKLICIANADRTRFATVNGSANLSSQPRAEQFIVSTSPHVFEFFVTNLFEWAFADGDSE